MKAEKEGGKAMNSNKRKTESNEGHETEGEKRSKMTSDLHTFSGRKVNDADSRLSVGVLGGTGLVGRALASRLLDHPSIKLGMVIGSPATAGKQFEDVWCRKEKSLVDHYGADVWKPQLFPTRLRGTMVHAFEDLLKAGPGGTGKVTMVVSAIAASHGWMEEELLKAGFDVFSISPYARFDKRAQLIVPEVNGSNLMRGVPPLGNGGRLFKSPNCVSCGLSLVLEAVRQRYGLKEVAVTTFQTLTGRGDLKYDLSLVKGNVYPLRNTIEDTDEYIRKEVGWYHEPCTSLR